MFGFSFMKLLVLGAIIAAVWYGFKVVGRLAEDRKTPVGQRKGGRTPSAANPGTEDMVACPECGTFVAANSAARCERANCPY
jgi:hypothetical protein